MKKFSDFSLSLIFYTFELFKELELDNFTFVKKYLDM